MEMTGFSGVLVGVDSSGSGHAVDWAAREATARSGRLTVCHVLRYPPGETSSPHGIPRSLPERGERLLDTVVERVRRTCPGLSVDSVLA